MGTLECPPHSPLPFIHVTSTDEQAGEGRAKRLAPNAFTRALGLSPVTLIAMCLRQVSSFVSVSLSVK